MSRRLNFTLTDEQLTEIEQAIEHARDDQERIETLLDVCYDLEAWGPVELREVRGRLDDALAEE